MIIVRSPLRISLGGGGTDLPSYYSQFGGFLIAAAIDRYIYITLHDTFANDLIIKYSEMERVKTIDEIRHPIIRESMRLLDVPPSGVGLEITSMADIPSGTGLGSSGSFTTALLKALYAWKKQLVHPSELAAQACHVEIDLLGEPIGKQDQYISAYGGVTNFWFDRDGRVTSAPVKIDKDTLYNLEDNLFLFFTGYSRSASSVLNEQDCRTKDNDEEMIERLDFVKKLAHKSQKALESGDLAGFAEVMNVHWQSKRQRSANMTNDKIDQWYQLGLDNGALGGKLIGAGGGGFLMFYAEDHARLRKAMQKAGLTEVRFRFDFEGTEVIVRS